jgi:hypothetical protein
MKAPAWLRFKIVTSFVIAGLGVVMFVRVAGIVPISPTTLIWFLAPTLFVIAGVWRGVIFLKADERSRKTLT